MGLSRGPRYWDGLSDTQPLGREFLARMSSRAVGKVMANMGIQLADDPG
jgi:hypothetical protein